MFVNCMNSGDVRMMLGYFENFGTPTCTSTETYMKERYRDKLSPAGSEVMASLVFPKPQDLAHYLAQIHTVLPDISVTMESNQIIQRQDMPGCEILLHQVCKGTQIFRQVELKFMDFDEPRECCHEQHAFPLHEVTSSDSVPPVLETALEIICNAYVKLTLNEEHKITSFDVRTYYQSFDVLTKRPIDEFNLSLMHNYLRLRVA
jgi:hypothetical protein